MDPTCNLTPGTLEQETPFARKSHPLFACFPLSDGVLPEGRLATGSVFSWWLWGCRQCCLNWRSYSNFISLTIMQLCDLGVGLIRTFFRFVLILFFGFDASGNNWEKVWREYPGWRDNWMIPFSIATGFDNWLKMYECISQKFHLVNITRVTTE